MTLTDLITSPDESVRNTSLDAACAGLGLDELLAQAGALDAFRRKSDNLYHRVRALLFLHAIHRFHLPALLTEKKPGAIPFNGYEHLLERRFEEAIDLFLKSQRDDGPSDAVSSALAAAYQKLAFQTLADQVRRSVRSVARQPVDVPHGPPGRPTAAHPPGTRHPRSRHRPLSGPARAHTGAHGPHHCGWSDIFFLGMDYPEGAKVLNISVDLAVHGRDKPHPAGRGQPARDRRTGAAPHQRRPRLHRGNFQPQRGVRFRQGLPRPAQGRGHRQRHRAARHRGLRPAASPIC
jgi:hypothetical protein